MGRITPQFTDRVLHLIGEKIHTYPQEAMRVNGSFDSQFVHLIKSTVNKFGMQSSADRVWNVFPISDPPSQDPHLRRPISGPPSQTPHLRPPTSSPPSQTPHLRPPISDPHLRAFISDPLAQTPDVRHQASHLRPFISDPPSQVLFPVPVSYIETLSQANNNRE